MKKLGPIALLVWMTCLSSLASAAENSGFANCDFEEGVKGWGVWYSDNPADSITRYPYSTDSSTARGGKQSLKIVAPDENGCAFVNRSSTAVKPGQRYAVSYWYRATPGLDTKKFQLRFNCRSATPPTGSARLIHADPLFMPGKTEGQWRQRTGYVKMPEGIRPSVQLGLYLRGARGTLWIDDVVVREATPDENQIANLWLYDPSRVELGGAPISKFRKLQESDDPIIGRAMRYNQTLVRSAFVKEDLRRLARVPHYGGRVDAKALDQLTAAMKKAEANLAEVYRAYGAAFLDRADKEKSARFDELLDALEAELQTLGGKLTAGIAAATQERRSAGVDWEPPPAPLDVGLPTIGPDGRVNQIIYAKRSLHWFQEIEKPLGLDPVHSVSVSRAGSDEPGKYDWSGCLKTWEAVREAGIAKRSCLGTSMVVHDGCYAAPWLLERAKADPELLHVTRPPVPLAVRSHCRPVNWWHPEVKQYAREIITDLGRAFKDRDEFLFYIFQAECVGPVVATEKGTRSVGYGRHAEADFHRWLTEKYGRIEQLNRRWGTDYASFERIAPPTDKLVERRLRTGPLEAEWDKWREESYHQWRRLIYRAWKESDPNKPVLASHSQIYLKFNDPEAFDNCDMLGWHYRGTEFMPVTLYLNSISRYNGYKPLAQYENFWGVQEDHDRMCEELPRRHGSAKHIFRLTVWNRFLQTWWYAYTAGSYLTTYDGNWCDPSYALTTLRYRSAALPVYFKKFKRLQQTLLESRIVPSRICVLAPSASMRNNYPYHATQTETRELFWQLFPRNDLYELVPEEYLTDGRAKLDDFDALVLPYAVYLSDSMQAGIEKWLKSGRRLLVAMGPFGLYDELGIDSRQLFDTVFNSKRLELEIPDPDRARWVVSPAPAGGLIEAESGQSRVVLLTRMISELAEEPGAIERLIERIEQAAPRPAFDERNLLEMVLRRQGDLRFLCVMNPDIDEPVRSVLHVRGRFGSVTDLDYPAGFPIAAKQTEQETIFPIRLAPGESTIIRLKP